jgi:uncharacterized protein
MKSSAAAFGAGVLFAVGLGLGGMTDPSRVQAFLDMFGAWDPTLLFVMGGALGTHLLLRAATRRAVPKPLFADAYPDLSGPGVDARLVVGPRSSASVGGWRASVQVPR